MQYALVTLALVGAAQAMPKAVMIARGMQGHGGSNQPFQGSGYTATPRGDLKTKCLQAHNDGRKAYGAPALVWDDALAASAQGWADHIGSDMEHSSANGYGENLAFNSNGDVRYMILGQWFDECPQYTGGFSEGAGHFSQCVWEGTQKVGCGCNSDNMLVCQYYPAGNMQGDYQNNVPRSRCVNAASLPVGYGGAAPAAPAGPTSPAAPTYGGSGQAPAAPAAPAAPSYGGSGQAPAAPAAPSYGGSGQAPAAPQAPTYGGSGQAPSHNRPPPPPPPAHKPKPKPADDCDDEGQSPSHGGKPTYHAPAPPKPVHGGRPQPQGDDCEDEGQSPSHGGGPSYGSHGSSPSHGGNYGGSSGGYGGHGGQSGGHGGQDDDCED